jgi:hypothetical protein
MCDKSRFQLSQVLLKIGKVSIKGPWEFICCTNQDMKAGKENYRQHLVTTKL